MQQASAGYRLFLLWGVVALISGTCSQNGSTKTVKSVNHGDRPFVAEAKSVPSLIHQRPAGIPNENGICYINAVLQVIAALYPEEVLVSAGSALRRVIEKMNSTPNGSIAKDDIRLFVDSLPEMYRNNSHRGGDVVRFLNALDTASPFLPEIAVTTRLFRWEQDAIKSCALQIPMPVILLYPPVDRGFRMEAPMYNDLTQLIASNQEVVVCHDGFLTELLKQPLLALSGGWRRVDLPAFVLKHQHLLNSVQSATKPVIMQHTYANLPNKLAIAFTRPGTKGSTTYDHSDLSGTEVVHIQQTSPPYVASFRLAAFIAAVVTIGPEPDHAIAFVERKGQWYCVNDAFVIPISHAEAIEASKQARLLFYRKANESKPCNPNL